MYTIIWCNKLHTTAYRTNLSLYYYSLAKQAIIFNYSHIAMYVYVAIYVCMYFTSYSSLYNYLAI